MTPAQRRALLNLKAGRPSSFGLEGMSAYGGHTKTVTSLRRMGWTDSDDNITEHGIRALDVVPVKKVKR